MNLYLYLALIIAVFSLLIPPGTAQYITISLAGGTLFFWLDERWSEVADLLEGIK